MRPILLSAPYGDPQTSTENQLRLPSGLRTTGFVEITLEGGITGLGEGYLAVFAPHVFESLIELIAPMLIGKDVRQLSEIVQELINATGYWSLQGAARHALGALEIALQDARARLENIAVWRMLGGSQQPLLTLYASGGTSIGPASMADELAAVSALGIETFKIRARSHQVDKVVWTQLAAAVSKVVIAVDMTQNLEIPSPPPSDVLNFVETLRERSGLLPAFLEEVLGADRISYLPELRRDLDVPIAGGEIVTTDDELSERVLHGYYDIVQPDATVIGGLGPVLRVFSAARAASTEVYVHCWGAGVGVLANYHVAAAAGGSTVEWPLPSYPLREELLKDLVTVEHGKLTLGDTPGLGIELTKELEREFPFREEAVYECVVDPMRLSRSKSRWPPTGPSIHPITEAD